MTGDSSD